MTVDYTNAATSCDRAGSTCAVILAVNILVHYNLGTMHVTYIDLAIACLVFALYGASWVFAWLAARERAVLCDCPTCSYTRPDPTTDKD